MGVRINPVFDINETELQYLGRGPLASGSIGWSRDDNIFYRCVNCGTFMKASTKNHFNCACGAMKLDIDYGRFGSNYGDENILVYRRANYILNNNIKKSIFKRIKEIMWEISKK